LDALEFGFGDADGEFEELFAVLEGADFEFMRAYATFALPAALRFEAIFLADLQTTEAHEVI
jgi:hypothetical protein